MGIWNHQSLAAYNEIILCEALIDAMTFWVNGFRNVTASYGTSGFTASHLAAFKQHNITRVLIAYDRDDAGNTAADQLAEKLIEQGIECFRILFPKKMDANDYALKMTPADKSLGLVIRQAQWMGQGGVPNIEHEINTQPTESKKTAAKEENHPVPTASPIPQGAQANITAEIKEHEIQITLGERFYRIRGLAEQTNSLKINLMLNFNEGFHSDKLDLYSAKQRTIFFNQASEELAIKADIIKKDLGKLLLKLEEIQQDQQTKAKEKDQPILLSSEEQESALNLLKDENLINIIREDFKKIGIVGENNNTLVGYLGCVSRKLDKPLAIMIQSSSAAGKSSLMDAILSLMPENECTQYSAMTGQSLFYLGENSLKHKILAISEEEGASNASYALKLLQSEGEVTIASTGKDNDSGQLVTQEYTVKGPTMLFMTTTAIDIDEELMNRCLVLSVNESQFQTQSIHDRQRDRRTLFGLQYNIEQETIATLHRHAQSLLRSLKVVNPYANQLTFVSNKTRTRRDHEKYLTLIDCIALLHQYQRPLKTFSHKNQEIDYIEVTVDDIELANQLANEVLGRTLDELPPQTRKLLTLILKMVTEESQRLSIEPSDLHFTRRQIREYTSWGNTQLKVHCHRLEELEYLLVHKGGRGQCFEYELLYQQNSSLEGSLLGLIDVNKLRYDEKKSGLKSDWSGSSRPQVGGVSAIEKPLSENQRKADSQGGSEVSKNVQAPIKTNGVSYRSDSLPEAFPLAAQAASQANH